MADPPIPGEGAAASAVPSSKMPLIPLLAAMTGAVLLSAAALSGAGYYLVKSGRLALPVTATAAAPAKVEAVAPISTHALVLEPLVVNLADEGGKSYLRLGLTLRVEDPELKKGEKPKEEKPKDAKGGNEAEASVRDIALLVLGGHTSADLLAPDGKERLKHDLRTALEEHDPELKVTGLFFTEFLVQR